MNKLFKKSPELKSLAEELVIEVYYRGGEYWGYGPIEFQLTYPRGSLKEDEPIRDLSSLECRIETALFLLNKIKNARAEWGTIQERFDAIIDGLRKELIPNYRPNTFSTWKHASLDSATIMCKRGLCSIWIKLVGYSEIEAEGETWEECISLIHNKFNQEQYIRYIEDNFNL